MTYDQKRDELSDATGDSLVKPYEAPRLTLIGNLNDLLAGTGSRDTDTQPVCSGSNGTITDPSCQ